MVHTVLKPCPKNKIFSRHHYLCLNSLDFLLSFFLVPWGTSICRQCFDAVWWALKRASGLQRTEQWGAGVVICLKRGANYADAADATATCFSKVQLGFIFVVPGNWDSSGHRAVKWVLLLLCFGEKWHRFCTGEMPVVSSIKPTLYKNNIKTKTPWLSMNFYRATPC